MGWSDAVIGADLTPTDAFFAAAARWRPSRGLACSRGGRTRPPRGFKAVISTAWIEALDDSPGTCATCLYLNSGLFASSRQPTRYHTFRVFQVIAALLGGQNGGPLAAPVAELHRRGHAPDPRWRSSTHCGPRL